MALLMGTVLTAVAWFTLYQGAVRIGVPYLKRNPFGSGALLLGAMGFVTALAVTAGLSFRLAMLLFP